jgi:hypothetical protein
VVASVNRWFGGVAQVLLVVTVRRFRLEPKSLR